MFRLLTVTLPFGDLPVLLSLISKVLRLGRCVSAMIVRDAISIYV